jgi:hypothetical protein
VMLVGVVLGWMQFCVYVYIMLLHVCSFSDGKKKIEAKFGDIFGVRLCHMYINKRTCIER